MEEVKKAEESHRSSLRVKGLQEQKAAGRAEMMKVKLSQTTTNLLDNREGRVRGTTGVAYSEDMLLHQCPWDPQHIERPARLELVWDRCDELGLVDRCKRLPQREATDQELLLYHSQQFLDVLGSSRSLDPGNVEKLCGELDSVYMCEHTDRAARLAAGAGVELVKQVLEGRIHNGMGLVRPPGHHAMENTPCGFCGFNNVVIAARTALEKGVKKIVIVDFDLHHGQGTQYAFYSDPRVVYMSVHRYERGSYWPHLRESNSDHIGEGAGLGFNVNVPLNEIGCGPADYLAVFHSVFLPIATEYQPELVLVSAGYDAAVGCPEGEMLVTPATYPHLVWPLAGLAGGRLVVLLEGGYCLDSLAESAALTLRCLLGDFCPSVRGGRARFSVMDSIKGTVTALRKFWRCLQVWETADTAACLAGSGTVFCPDLSFSPPVGWPPSTFPTRDYYLVYSQEDQDRLAAEFAKLVLNTSLRDTRDRLCVLYDPMMERHEDDEPHPECPERTSRIFAALTEAGLFDRRKVNLLDTGRKVTEEEVLLVHDQEHWDRLRDSVEMDQEERVEMADKLSSIYMNSWSVECGLLAAGGVLACVDQTLAPDGAPCLAVVRPPGHHAEQHTPHGFCLFNNVGIAAQYAVSQHGLKKVLVLDWDVHHGNGLQHMFYSSPNVLYISLHRYDYASFFPESEDANYDMVGEEAGRGFNVNIPWNGQKMGDSEYLLAFQSIVIPIAYEFQPELVLVSAGFDAAQGDPLGGFRLSPAMYGFMTHQLACLAEGRLVLALEGGYNLASISSSMLMCARALLGDPLPPLQLTNEVRQSAVNTVRDVISALSPYWACLQGHQMLLPDSQVLAQTMFEQRKADIGGSVLEREVDDVSRSFRRIELETPEGEEKDATVVTDVETTEGEEKGATVVSDETTEGEEKVATDVTDDVSGDSNDLIEEIASN